MFSQPGGLWAKRRKMDAITVGLIVLGIALAAQGQWLGWASYAFFAVL